MTEELKIECGLAQVGDVMLCADCQKATTLFRERCITCRGSNVFTVKEVFDGRANLAALDAGADLNWIASIIDELFVSASSASTARIAA